MVLYQTEYKGRLFGRGMGKIRQIGRFFLFFLNGGCELFFFLTRKPSVREKSIYSVKKLCEKNEKEKFTLLKGEKGSREGMGRNCQNFNKGCPKPLFFI